MGLKNRALGVFCVVGIMLIGLVLPVFASAAGLPLPPRPNPKPTVVVDVEKEEPPSPTLITLSVGLTPGVLGKGVDPEALWTVVQWQDALGEWHAVEGWAGPLDTIDATHGEKSWGVAHRNFGESPFRWLVYAKQGGTLVAATETFMLPSSSGRVLTVQAVPVAK